MLTSRVVRYMHANTSLGATKGEGWGEWLSCTLKVFLLGVSAVIAGFHSDVMMVSIGFCLLSCGPRVAGYLDMVSILDVPIGCQFGIADWGNREQLATGFYWFFFGFCFGCIFCCCQSSAFVQVTNILPRCSSANATSPSHVPSRLGRGLLSQHFPIQVSISLILLH